jgi:DNA repair photolyase
MKYTDMLDRIEALIKDGLDPNCITMRIDPIIPGVTLVKDIEEIMKRSAKMGIKRVKFSVCDMYPGGYYKENGVKKYKHNSWEVALDLTEQKYGKAKRDELWNTLVSVYGLNPVDNTKLNKHAPQQRIEAIANVMVQFAEKYGLTLSSCAENINHPKVQKTGCLAVSQVNEMLGTSVEDKGFANNRQRSLCSCFGGKIDLLP